MKLFCVQKGTRRGNYQSSYICVFIQPKCCSEPKVFIKSIDNFYFASILSRVISIYLKIALTIGKRF